MQQGLDKLVELNISEAQSRSLQKCGEVIKAYYIPSKAMLPTLQVNDRIILDKTAYRTQTPRRGDIVIFQPTKSLQQQNFKEVFIKRVIGLPGERVEVRNGTVYINKKPVKEAYIAERPQYQYGPVVIPRNSYFVLGDNRNNSHDSHYWGFVPRDLIVGKVVWRYYPLDRAGSLSQ
ncbi:signal peptidase I [Leptolyngbya sp. FACHB-36]|nr:signal peptidase I [Leptolyngbya sp. FACHB-36]